MKIWRVILLLPTLVSAVTAVSGPVSYNRDIRPVLSENCFACHGADSASRQAGLRLDHVESATNRLDNGMTAIVPGQPEKSELVRRIFLTDDDQMPPEKIHKTLTPAQKELLKKRIAAGAKYEPHWSFLPPQKAPVPAVKNSKWVKMDVKKLGASFNLNMKCWETLLPHVVRHPLLRVDLMPFLCAYQRQYPGAM